MTLVNCHKNARFANVFSCEANQLCGRGKVVPPAEGWSPKIKHFTSEATGGIQA